jgi:hypothetical protein
VGSASSEGGDLSPVRRVFATCGASSDDEGSGGRPLAVLALLLALALAFAAAPAAARVTRLSITSFGKEGTSGATLFGDNADLTFNKTSKKLYVINRGIPNTTSGLIYGFDASVPGAYSPLLSPFPITITQTSSKPGIGVNSATGSFYYASASTASGAGKEGKIFGYNSSGAELNSGSGFPNFPIDPGGVATKILCGVSVDPTTQNIAVGNNKGSTNAKIFLYDSTGALLTPINSLSQGQVCKVAFDSVGALYASVGAPPATAGIWKYAAAGTGTLTNGSLTISSVSTKLGQFVAGQPITGTGIPAGATIATVSPGELTISAAATESKAGVSLTSATRVVTTTPTAIAVDPSTNHLFAASGNGIVEYECSGFCGSATKLAEFGPNTFGNGVENAIYEGVAVAPGATPAETKIYASDSFNKKVQVFGPVVTLPDPTTNLATGISHFSATLNGHLDPAGGPDVTDCHFEWGRTAAYGKTAPCVGTSPAPPSAPFSAAADVTAALNETTVPPGGLTAGAEYHYRLDLTNSEGSVHGGDRSFTTTEFPIVHRHIVDFGLNGTCETATGTGTLVSGSPEVTSLAMACGTFAVGQTITGTGIAAGTTITEVLPGEEKLVLSANATVSGSLVALNVFMPFADNNQLAFNQTTKSLYVLNRGASFDTAPGSIYGFDATAPGTPGSPGSISPLASPFPLSVAATGLIPDIAVDNTALSSAGRIYDVSYKEGKVFAFDSAGAPLNGGSALIAGFAESQICGSAVDSAGNIWIGNAPAKKIKKYDSTGTALLGGDVDTTAQGESCHVAFDSNNDMYITRFGSSGVWKYTAASGYASATQFDPGTTRAIAVDPVTHHVFMAGSNVVVERDSEGSFVDELATGIPGANFNGVAVDRTSHDVYVSDAGNKMVHVYGPGEPELPIETLPATGKSATRATLNGKVNPEESTLTNCRFDWGTTVAYGKTAPCKFEYEAGKFTEDISKFPKDLVFHNLSAALTKLTPNSQTYHFRVVASTALGSSFGKDESFSTANAVITGAATGVTDTTGTLNGTVNSDGVPITGCHFDYVTEAAFQETGFSKLGSGGSMPCAGSITTDEEAHPVSAALSGLATGTTYRFRLVASYGSGIGTVIAGTETLVTKGPEVTNVGAYAITENSARLVATINPKGSATSYQFKWGLTNSYGNVVPAVPASVGGGTNAVFVDQPLSGLSPSTTYHFKLTVGNAGGTPESGDLTFTTRAVDRGSPGSCPNEAFRTNPYTSLSSNLPDCRAYEMLTPPFKAERAVGPTGASFHRNATPALPSLDGQRTIWANPIFPLLESQTYPWVFNYETIPRDGVEGWLAESLITKAPILPSEAQKATPSMLIEAMSGDLGVQAWSGPEGQPLLPAAGSLPSYLYTRKDGTGDHGFTNWLSNPEAATVPYGLANPASDHALFNDDGSSMTRWGFYRGLLGAGPAQDASVTQLPGREGGQTIYHQANPPEGPIDLVNGCTGAALAATRIPARLGTGVATDTIGTQTCEPGSATSKHGAALGGGSREPSIFAAALMAGPAATAMSNDGRRVFFDSPDPGAVQGLPGAVQGLTSCAAATGAATDCPPQLFVRQYDENGENPVVRWISSSRSHLDTAALVATGVHSYDGAMIAGQQIGLLGVGVGFEGASRDGGIVYFRTNAPLTPDDPNGAGVAPPVAGVTTGKASDNSWDLYQYRLPSNLSEDPAGGTLTRISGGPVGTADPDTNGHSTETNTGVASRYISDDGKRAYFATTSPVAGADETPPQGGITVPGGEVGNTATRNLYLFDENLSGAARYKFIAKVAVGCASDPALDGRDLSTAGFGLKVAIKRTGNKCFRGTPSGDAAIFETTSRLTADDTDNAQDIYLYDARTDELTRVSAPPPGVGSYGCQEANNFEHTATLFCNADLGFGTVVETYDTARGWGGGRGINLSEDSEGNVSVYFESRSSLVPQDTNGDYWDTYQWRDGKLSLISPGDTEDDAYYSGNSLDGHDVFIETSQRIDPREIDPKDNDIYDARVGGGFAYTPPSTPCDVLAHECRGAISAPPAASTAASHSMGGSGNVKKSSPKPHCAKGKVRKHGKCVKGERKHHQRRAAYADRGAGK